MGEVNDDPIVITGATATGKTRLAVALAREIGGEVISMDSRQVYRGMDIGTAKPDLDERDGVPHHGFDLVDPDQRYSAGHFARDARACIAAIRARGATPILAGGTGFFLRALTRPMFREPPLETGRRQSLRELLDRLSTDQLRQWVGTIENTAFDGWGGGGRQRLVRRIEVALLTGRPLSWWQQNAPPVEPPLRPRVFVLGMDRASLVRRIEGRVLDMVRDGLVDEVRSLLDRGYTAADPGMNATGYIEFVPHVRGSRALDESIRLTQQATRRYARRQVTWFGNQLDDTAVRLDASLETGALRDLVVREVKGVEH
jgi:tRNA dimethylallyltransferase